jgi:hypothetical protein
MLPFPFGKVKNFLCLMTGAICNPVALRELLRISGSVNINPRMERLCCRTSHANGLDATLTSVVRKLKTVGWMYRSWLFPLGCFRWNVNGGATHALYLILLHKITGLGLLRSVVAWEIYVHTFPVMLLITPSLLHALAHCGVLISTAVAFLIFEIFQVRRSFSVSQ